MLTEFGGVTAFNIAGLERDMLSFTDDVSWNSAETSMMANCKRRSSAQLTAVQQAVYSYMCIRWNLFSDCDLKQSENGALDEAGMLRQARFLAGHCPLSPAMLLDAFGMVTGRTWEECSKNLYSGDDVNRQYGAQISRTACLLQNFNGVAGNIDFVAMVERLRSLKLKEDPHSMGLLRMVADCTGCDPLSPNIDTSCYPNMTAESFIKCWAGKGVFSCADMEANRLASTFPQTCIISVDTEENIDYTL